MSLVIAKSKCILWLSDKPVYGVLKQSCVLQQVIAYAMKERDCSLDAAYQHVKQKRSCIKPNAGFMQQLTTYQGILDAR